VYFPVAHARVLYLCLYLYQARHGNGTLYKSSLALYSARVCFIQARIVKALANDSGNKGAAAAGTAAGLGGGINLGPSAAAAAPAAFNAFAAFGAAKAPPGAPPAGFGFGGAPAAGAAFGFGGAPAAGAAAPAAAPAAPAFNAFGAAPAAAAGAAGNGGFVGSGSPPANNPGLERSESKATAAQKGSRRKVTTKK